MGDKYMGLIDKIRDFFKDKWVKAITLPEDGIYRITVEEMSKEPYRDYDESLGSMDVNIISNGSKVFVKYIDKL